MFLSSTKEINKLMSKVVIEKNWRSQNFDFLSLKKFSLGQFLEITKSSRYHEILELLVTTLKSEVWQQNCLLHFYYFTFDKNFDAWKSKSQKCKLY